MKWLLKLFGKKSHQKDHYSHNQSQSESKELEKDVLEDMKKPLGETDKSKKKPTQKK